MKIAFILSVFPSVSETFILNQITGLIEMGHDVRIFAKYPSKEKNCQLDIRKYNLMGRVHYYLLPRNKGACILKIFYLLVVNFPKNPVKVLKSLKVFEYGLKIATLELINLIILLLNRVDIIYCHFGINGLRGLYVKDIVGHIKLITVFHGYDMSKFIDVKGKDVYKDLFRKCNLCMPISDYWKKKLIQLGCNENKIVVHRMGVNLTEFRFDERELLTEKPLNIITVGRLVEKKGYEYAIKAIAKVIEKHKNIRYFIAGAGVLRNKLESLVSELQIKEYVKFLGQITQEEIKELYRMAHIFILPSITAKDGDQEGIPVVLLEAQAAGLPVISTFHSGIPEAVINRKTGYLVPEKNENALVEKLEYLIAHPQLLIEMGQNGRNFIEKNYNIKILNKKLIQIFKSL